MKSRPGVIRGFLASIAAGLLLASAGEASVITFTIPSGTTVGGQPVAATATITTSLNDVLIQLTNLQANPTSVIQNLSDFELVLSTGQTAATLSSSSALARTIASGGTFTDGGIVSTGWAADVGDIGVHVLGTAIGPAHTLIGGPNGSSVYSNANGSIAGNGPHNPFLTGTTTFDLAVLGVTGESFVRSVTFSFGTTPGVNVPGTRIPEPSTLLLLGAGLVLLRTFRLRSGRP